MKGRPTVPADNQVALEDKVSERKIRCVLVHDQTLFREGLRRLLEDESDIELVAESVNGAEALRHIFEHRPDVVMAGAHVFEGPREAAQKLMRHESPQTRVVFFSPSAEDDVKAASGQSDETVCVARHASTEELVTVIRKMVPERLGIIREMPRKMVGEWEPSKGGRPRKRVLTAREREVLKLLAEGRTVRSAAAVLGLSVKTVDAHKFNLMRKLGIHNKAELVMWAIQKRVVKLPANF
jgi:DNA-binding NarL/FixJ family response regulator